MRSRSGLRQEWRRRILNFTPSWFSVNMGTGICSILLYNLPYQFNGLHIIADVVFVLNIVLFLAFLLLSILRYIIWPSVFWRMLSHSQQSLFLGTFPMGFATIVNMVVFACVPSFGHNFVLLAWVLWWIDVVVAVVIAVGVPFVMFTYHHHEVSGVTAVWLQPSVATIVAAASGAIVAEHLSPANARLTVIVSYIILGLGFMPSLLIMALYLQRLAIHKCPASTLIVSTFLPLGPCGQGAFAILRLSAVVRSLMKANGATSLYTAEEVALFGNAIYAASIPVAFTLWGFGLFWLIIAISSIIELARREKIGFNMGWWAFTFPLGVFTTATTQLATELDSKAFRILGTIFSCCVVAFWLYVGAMTLLRSWTGVLFKAPCLGGEEAAFLTDAGICSEKRGTCADLENGRS